MSYAPTIPDELDASASAELLRGAGEYLAGLQRIPHDERGESFVEDARSARDFILNFDAVHKSLLAEEQSRSNEYRGRGGEAGFDSPTNQFRSIGERVVDDERYRAIAHDRRSDSDFRIIDVEGSLFDRQTRNTITTTGASGTDNFGGWLPVAQPVPPLVQQRRAFVRDLMPVWQTSFRSIPFIQEVHPASLEGGASTVLENTAKPEVEMITTPVDAPIRKIAAWVPVTTEIIEDAPMVMGYVNDRLAYLVLICEERQILSGTGTAPQIEGIRTNSNKQLQAAVAGDVPATLGQAYAKVGNVDLDATGVVMNIFDYWSAVTSRHATMFDSGYGGGAPAFVSSISWGKPVVQTRAIEQSKAIVGAFSSAATLLDHRQVQIRVGNQHSDYFTNNKVAILVEEQVGLMNQRPDGFVECTVTF